MSPEAKASWEGVSVCHFAATRIVGTIWASLPLPPSGALCGGSWCGQSEECGSFQVSWGHRPHYLPSQCVMVITL